MVGFKLILFHAGVQGGEGLLREDLVVVLGGKTRTYVKGFWCTFNSYMHLKVKFTYRQFAWRRTYSSPESLLAF